MNPSRLELVAYQKSVVTPDTAEGLRQVELNAAGLGNIRIAYQGVQRPQAAWWASGPHPHLSMRPAGREVRLRAHITGFEGTEEARREYEVALMWGITLPCGFTPWNRYPIPGQDDDLFHFLGPWKRLHDHICAEGRGETAWASMCAAAQVDVGTWGGDRAVERFVQAQLHRLGLHCGPVDGQIGERTLQALQALGVSGSTLDETAEALAAFRTPQPNKEERRYGNILLPGDDLVVTSYGEVYTTQTNQGVAVTVDGPGKIVITVGQEV